MKITKFSGFVKKSFKTGKMFGSMKIPKGDMGKFLDQKHHIGGQRVAFKIWKDKCVLATDKAEK